MPKKYTFREVDREISSLGFILLSKHYANGGEKLDVMCNACEHRWTPTFYNILAGSGCPSCYGNVRYSEQEVSSILKSRSIELLSKYKNNRTKIKTRCMKCDNIWHPTFKNINVHGQGCPRCNISKSQKELYNILLDIFSDYEILSNFKGFDWLINNKTGRRQEIDLLVRDKDVCFLAIEYDGEQHFKPMRYKNASDKFNQTKKLDRLKNRKIKSRLGREIKYFVRFTYKDKLDKLNVINKLKASGVEVPE